VKQSILKAVLAMLLLAMALIFAFVRPGTLATPVQAKPAFMDRYNRDPYAKAQWKDKCTLCHIGKGGEQRNDFGEAFDEASYRITPKLRAKFPNRFAQEPSKDKP